jgi:hypothetical protein
MTALATTVTHHFGTGITDVGLAGELDVTGASRVRSLVRKCIAEAPNAVIVDLTELVVVSDIALTVFPALCRQQAHHDSPVPLLLHARRDTPTGAVVRSAIGNHVPVHPDRSAAVRVLEGFETWRRRGHLHMPPVPASAAASRSFAVEFCRRIGVPHLVDPARVVANELVTNGIRHARTELDLAMACGRTYLSISVRDCSTTPPCLSIGHAEVHPFARRTRGLALVDRLSASWGTFAHADGKTVWANLRIWPVIRS